MLGTPAMLELLSRPGRSKRSLHGAGCNHFTPSSVFECRDGREDSGEGGGFENVDSISILVSRISAQPILISSDHIKRLSA